MNDNSNYFKELLIDEGYRPTVDEDGDIMFKVQGDSFELLLDQRDPSYVRLMLRYRNDAGASTERSLAVANEANLKFKGVKTSVRPESNGVAFSYEAFYEDGSHFKPFLHRALRALAGASDEFFENLRTRNDSGSDTEGALGEL